MGSSIERVAQAPLATALGPTATGEDGRATPRKGGRAGQGGPTRRPLVEVADTAGSAEPRPGPHGPRGWQRGRHAVVFPPGLRAGNRPGGGGPPGASSGPSRDAAGQTTPWGPRGLGP